MNALLNEQINQCVAALKSSKVVAFPTETVMVLGVIYNSREAYDLLNQIKCRPEDKPYTMMVSKVEDIEQYAYVDEKVRKVINHFMPGSLTILLKELPSMFSLNLPLIKASSLYMPSTYSKL